MGDGGVPRARYHQDRLRGETDGLSDEARTGTDQQRAQFLAVVSHEMRTPLTSIISFSELLR
ncbi:MAG TPA: histidine kinase dimerization/phospho-acceptor domain-containing protein, partial [Trebonia sp.]|nr:histidine kinase dimerization/phospho-acceptor domain-containing protein [Trebonia sp.]